MRAALKRGVVKRGQVRYPRRGRPRWSPCCATALRMHHPKEVELYLPLRVGVGVTPNLTLTLILTLILILTLT